ncbi:3'-5' exonuclease [Orrella sp. 11846]|uniref:3'-5' exonuclease n=1 Tax=Orrella sp. 11846 TaxID=3409913 RepID=UPI003B59A033
MLHSSLLHLPSEKHPKTVTSVDWAGRFVALAEQAKDPRLKAYYSAGMPSGETPIRDVPLMALDVETTGLNPMKDGIVSIGLLPMTLDRILSSRSKHWIVQPHVPLADASVTLHHITHTQVENAPKLIDILDPVLHAIAGHVLVVHCRAIERNFLNNALTRMIHEPLEMPMIDTMELEARIHRRKPAGSWWQKLLGRPVEQTSIRLAASRARYNLPFYKPHHALTDALATAELLQAQIADRFSPETPLDELWR